MTTVCCVCGVLLGECLCQQGIRPNVGTCPCQHGYYVYEHVSYCCKCWFDSGKAKECADENVSTST